MSYCAAFLFLFGAWASIASPASNPLTLLLQFEEAHPPASITALDTELQNIVSGSNLQVRFAVRTSPLLTAIAGELIVFKMRGNCSMAALPVAAVSDERGALAMTHIVDGEMLPFAEVECDRVRESVQRTVGKANPRLHETQYNLALARVMAHELYHILAKSTLHDTVGLSKKSLSSRELSQGNMVFSDDARTLISPR